MTRDGNDVGTAREGSWVPSSVQVLTTPRVGMWYAGWAPGVLDSGVRPGPNILEQLGESYRTLCLSLLKH